VTGVVYLVGAGPGDPRLLTLRGAEVLQRADVVIHDRLIPEALLDLAPAKAERVDVGKEPGAGASQEEINRLVVRCALAGGRVVRLKGGDPFVFGRGAEEALACAEAGVPFEVVPGVSAAIAAPALAGIPVTHRGVASSFAVATATLAGGEANELRAVAASVDTLVVLMAAHLLVDVCAEIVAAGRAADTPAAVVEQAGTLRQRVISGTLASLPDLARAADVRAPATLVVGEVVELAGSLAVAGAGARTRHAGLWRSAP
jgi:uroporphyrin-III C-methyltransferase